MTESDQPTTAAGVTMRRRPCPQQRLSVFVKELLEVGPTRVIMPTHFEDWHETFATFPVQPSDVWVVTFPKSGTTWTQELVWCLLNGLDHPRVDLPLMRRFPFFEFDSLIPPSLQVEGLARDHMMLPGNTWAAIASLPAPRTIKSHLPKQLLPRQLWHVKPKVVYVSRDPRDVCVSHYFHSRKLEGFTGSFDDFVDLFLQDKFNFCPVWPHILDFWKLRHEDHVLFLRYEDMQEDMARVVRQVAGFLGVTATEEEVERLVHHCSFPQMRDNPATNNEDFLDAPTPQARGIRFMRKGQVGDWRNHLSENQLARFRAWTVRGVEGSDFPHYQDYH